MTKCKTCKWRDRCDLDCGDPQGFSYEPDSEDERIERDEDEEEDNDGEEDSDND